MGKPTNDVATAVGAALGAAATADKQEMVTLYLIRPWTTGTGMEYPAHVDGAEPVTFNFNDLPKGVTVGAIDYLISTGGAESGALRDARLKAARA